MRLNDIRFSSPSPVNTIGVETKSIIELPIASLLDIVSVGSANVGFHVEAVVSVKDGVTSYASMRAARAFRLIGGSLTALGTQAAAIGVGIGDAALGTALSVLDASGTTLRVRGTGITLLTLEWTAHVHIWSGEF